MRGATVSIGTHGTWLGGWQSHASVSVGEAKPQGLCALRISCCCCVHSSDYCLPGHHIPHIYGLYENSEGVSNPSLSSVSGT